MKLTDARNAKEVLPGKKKALDYDEDWHNRTGGFLPNNDKKEEKGFNKAIDAYNNVLIEGDVETLARIIQDSVELRHIADMHHGEWTAIDSAKKIITSMPTWVVVRKDK